MSDEQTGGRDTATPAASRRRVLGGLVGVTGLTTGCIQRLQNVIGRDTDQSPSLTIKTMPADADEQAVSISQTLADNLAAVGVDATVVPMARSQLYRAVLINHDFDLYVARFPAFGDPDFLRPLLHSRFSEALGWLNPFGFTDLTVDTLLAKQRTATGRERARAISKLQRNVVRRQPFTAVAFPDTIQAVRPDRYGGWSEFDPASPLSYLRLRPRNPALTPGSDAETRLRATTTDGRVTENLNPLMVTYRTGGTFVDLVYDRLAWRYDGGIRPWLAQSWAWETDRSAKRQRLRVNLRAAARWHDGRAVTASDVAFTYRFLADTSLGKHAVPVPAPRFHGRVSLVDAVEVLDRHTVRIDFGACGRAVASRALSVPVLPRHEWRSKTGEPHVFGLDLSDGVTEALVWKNGDPVGSGPLQFEHSASGEQLVLARFDEHFVHGETPDIAGPVGNGVPFDQLGVRVVPSKAVGVSLLAVDRADVTATHVNPDVVPRIRHHDDLRLHTTSSRSFYHVGFNARNAPLSNARFRRLIARLVDRRRITSDVFDGYATPAVSPLGGSEWVAPALGWTGESPVLPFFGDDGRLDVARARAAFRDAGYRPGDAKATPTQ